MTSLPLLLILLLLLLFALFIFFFLRIWQCSNMAKHLIWKHLGNYKRMQWWEVVGGSSATKGLYAVGWWCCLKLECCLILMIILNLNKVTLTKFTWYLNKKFYYHKCCAMSIPNKKSDRKLRKIMPKSSKSFDLLFDSLLLRGDFVLENALDTFDLTLRH